MLRVKVTFAVFQSGTFSEYVDATYTFENPIDGMKAMAELTNTNQFAYLSSARRHMMQSTGLFQPPSTKDGLGAGTVLVVNNIEVL